MSDKVRYMSDRTARILNTINAKLKAAKSFLVVEPVEWRTERANRINLDPSLVVRYNLPKDEFAETALFDSGNAPIMIKDNFYKMVKTICDDEGVRVDFNNTGTHFWFSEKVKS